MSQNAGSAQPFWRNYGPRGRYAPEISRPVRNDWLWQYRPPVDTADGSTRSVYPVGFLDSDRVRAHTARVIFVGRFFQNTCKKRTRTRTDGSEQLDELARGETQWNDCSGYWNRFIVVSRSNEEVNRCISCTCALFIGTELGRHDYIHQVSVTCLSPRGVRFVPQRDSQKREYVSQTTWEIHKIKPWVMARRVYNVYRSNQRADCFLRKHYRSIAEVLQFQRSNVQCFNRFIRRTYK